MTLSQTFHNRFEFCFAVGCCLRNKNFICATQKLFWFTYFLIGVRHLETWILYQLIIFVLNNILHRINVISENCFSFLKICDVKFIFSSANDNFYHKIEIEAAIHYSISYRESKRISGFNLWFFHLCHIIVTEHLMHDKLFVEYYFFDLDIRNGSVCFVSYLRKQLPLLLRDFRIKNYVSRITH